MSDYTKLTDFAVKDSLPVGDPYKIVRGTELDVEFDNIQQASGSKADKDSPEFTGDVTLENLTINGDIVYNGSQSGTVDGGVY